MNELAVNSLQTDENNTKPVDYGAKLRPKQRKFVHLYHLSGNATQSAIKAGYSEKTASTQGYENINKPHVIAYLTQLQQETEAEHKAIFGSIIQRTNEITREAQRGKLQTNSKGEPVMVDGKPVYVKEVGDDMRFVNVLISLC